MPLYTSMSGGLFVPRPLRGDTTLGRALLSIEMPECDCPLTRMCLHERDPRRHPDCPGVDKCQECPVIPNRECPHAKMLEERISSAGELTPERCEAITKEWAEMLARYDPDGYADPPSPETPASVVLREVRVKQYHKRGVSGRGFFHPLDVTAARADRVSVQGAKGLVQEGVRASRTKDLRALVREKEIKSGVRAGTIEKFVLCRVSLDSLRGDWPASLSDEGWPDEGVLAVLNALAAWDSERANPDIRVEPASRRNRLRGEP